MSKRILVVEDKDDIAQMFAAFLKSHGYDTEIATAPEEGLRLAARGRFDLILLDLMMPGMNGLDFTEAVRERDAETPILMVTGRDDDGLVKRVAHMAGANDVMFKPVEPGELILRVGSLMEAQTNGTS
jgi:DNA-binding response OmpR family regulator